MKTDLPYFTHDNNASQHPKMKALITEYGFEGYGRFWILNEKIARNEGAYIDISRKLYKLDLANELRVDSEGLDKFLAFLSDPEVDLINIKDGKITTDRINELYKKTMGSREKERNRKLDKKGNDDIPDGKDDFPVGKEDIPDTFLTENDTDKIRSDKIRSDKKKSKVKKSKVNSIGSGEPTDEKQSSKQKPDKPKKPPLRERDPVNDLERVEKVYLKNWDALYAQGKVKTPDPVINWGQARKLLKNHLEKLTPEQIIQAVNNGLKDDWVMKKGYSLCVILSASMMNGFINAAHGAAPVSKHQREKINLE
jgi:hypothetical protein